MLRYKLNIYKDRVMTNNLLEEYKKELKKLIEDFTTLGVIRDLDNSYIMKSSSDNYYLKFKR